MVDALTTAGKLEAEFPEAVLKTVQKGSANLLYIPVAEVIQRMNNVLGVENWSTQVINVWRDQIDTAYVVAHVRLTALIDGKGVVRDGFGGVKIKMSGKGGPVDLGDEYKGAVSDALKKACQTLGVGLYLARSEEAIYADEETPQVDPETEQLFDNLKGHSRKLDDAGKQALNEFWNNYGKGKPKPRNPAEADKNDLKALIAEAIRLDMGGEYV